MKEIKKIKQGYTLAKDGILIVHGEWGYTNMKDYKHRKISFKKFCNRAASPETLENSKTAKLCSAQQVKLIEKCQYKNFTQQNKNKVFIQQSSKIINTSNLKTGFTLAEVLLTLAVIGIVAAITLPSLLVDTTEKAFDAQRHALHARLAQAIGMMSSLSGYGTYIEDEKDDDGNVTKQGTDNAAETFLYEGLSKVYKINNICDSDNLDKCGIPANFTTMAGNTMNFPKKLSELNEKLINSKDGQASDKSTTDTKVAAFETVNGESIAVFYNPNCKNDQESGSNKGNNANTDPNNWYDWFYIQNKMCVNFIYDLNGLKGPNKTGKDIGFITALYAKNSEVVAPIPFNTDVDGKMNQQQAIETCGNFSDDSRLPNKHELSSIFYNKNLIGNFKTDGYWSSSILSLSHAWIQDFNGGGRYRRPRSIASYARCIKK